MRSRSSEEKVTLVSTYQLGGTEESLRAGGGGGERRQEVKNNLKPEKIPESKWYDYLVFALNWHTY